MRTRFGWSVRRYHGPSGSPSWIRSRSNSFDTSQMLIAWTRMADAGVAEMRSRCEAWLLEELFTQ